jgi:hypothetical protein
VSNAELARRAYELRQAQFLSGLNYEIGTEALPVGTVRGFIMPIAIKAGFALVAGLAAIALGWRRIVFRAAGAVLVVIAAFGAATVFFMATRNPPLLPASIPTGDERQVVELLSQAAGLEPPADGVRKISDSEVNRFSARHVRISGSPVEAERQSLALRFLPGKIVIFEMVQSMGLSWIVRLDLEAKAANGAIAVTPQGAKLGALDCSRDIAAALWKNLEPQLSAILSSSRVAEAFAAQTPGEGAMELLPGAAAQKTMSVGHPAQ